MPTNVSHAAALDQKTSQIAVTGPNVVGQTVLYCEKQQTRQVEFLGASGDLAVRRRLVAELGASSALPPGWGTLLKAGEQVPCPTEGPAPPAPPLRPSSARTGLLGTRTTSGTETRQGKHVRLTWTDDPVRTRGPGWSLQKGSRRSARPQRGDDLQRAERAVRPTHGQA